MNLAYNQLQSTLRYSPLRADDELERWEEFSAEKCLLNFIGKGGKFRQISSLIDVSEPQIRWDRGDAVYPVCSGGFCRSQALWAILQPFASQIVLFPPHAARHGWDPYNGQINRGRNYIHEDSRLADEFTLYFGREKSLRFGFENISDWQHVEALPTAKGLLRISEFYNHHYFGPHSSFQGGKGHNRIYIAFSNNAHVMLYRLAQANLDLSRVILIAIDSADLITTPPSFLQTTSRTTQAYHYFTEALRNLFSESRTSSH